MWIRPRLLVLVMGLLLFDAPEARACGGTFCDVPPPGSEPMPVDQSGENVVFYMIDGFVEAHVQIQYTGDPERFAWLVPLPAEPEVTVGSKRLLDALLRDTAPIVTLNYSFESCTDGSTRSSSPGGGCGGPASMSDDSADFGGEMDGGYGGEPTTDEERLDPELAREQVGAFDVTILTPTGSTDVTAWLDTNGFLQTPDAAQIIQEYVDQGHVFAAIQFTPGAGVNEVHPLVFRYQGTEPCIPLKLTRVAATEDMPVRVFFLGDRRVVPTDYAHVVLNPAQIDWSNLGSNYMDVVARAVDEAPGGLGFITEFAGVASRVDGSNVSSAEWDAEVFRTADPTTVIDLLEGQGLVSCSSPELCEADHPLVLPIVRRYLPAPDGMSEPTFYRCLECALDLIDATAWDGNAFADELFERVIAPGRHAEEILQNSTYLSRLLTSISPDEMTSDPMFTSPLAGLAGVDGDLDVTMHQYCAGAFGIRGTGVPEYALDAGSAPDFQEMAYALRVEVFDSDGSLVSTDDRGDDVAIAIRAWNEEQDYPPPLPPRSSSSGSSSSRDDGFRCSCGIPRRVHQGHVLSALLLLGVLRRRSRRR